MTAVDHIIDLLKEQGPLSTAEMAAEFGLDHQAVDRVVHVLQSLGVTELSEIDTPRYRLKPHFAHIIGVHVQPARLSAVCTDLFGNELAKVTIPRGQSIAFDRTIVDVAESVAQRAGIHFGQVDRIVVGVERRSLTPSRIRRRVPAGTYWRESLATALEFLLGTCVRVTTATALAATAEARFGAAQNLENFVLVHADSPGEVGVVIDGRLYDGAQFYVGGDQVLPPHVPGASTEIALSAVVRPSAGPMWRRLRYLVQAAKPELVIIWGQAAASEGARSVRALEAILGSRQVVAPRIAVSRLPADIVLSGAIHVGVTETRSALRTLAESAHPDANARP